MELIDLSYYKILPQLLASNPKALVSEVTNEIEYLACTDTYNTSIDYTNSKIMEVCGIRHEPVYWGTDLKFYENNYVTLTKFDLSKEWIYFGDSDKLDSFKNKAEIDFCFMIAPILGAGMWAEDLIGFADNNIFVKSFHSNMMFEIELAMYVSGLKKATAIFDRTLFGDESLQAIDKNVLEEVKPFADRFLNTKKSDWYDILKFPQNSKYEKCKYWAIRKISNCQKIIKSYYK